MLTTGKIHGMSLTFGATFAMVLLFNSDAVFAEPLGYVAPINHPALLLGQTAREPDVADDTQTPDEIPAHLHRHVVNYSTREAPGTIVIDTPDTYLYFVLGGGKAIRYGIRVGREGFTWFGVKAVSVKRNGRTGYRPPKCFNANPICRVSWLAALEIHLAHAPCISAASLPHPRNECRGHNRQTSIEWMHPHAE